MNGEMALAAVVLAPWAAALFAAVSSRFGLAAPALARVAATVVGAGCGAAVLAGITTIATGTIAGVSLGATALRLDALALAMSVLVLGLSALVQTFAIRYLRGDGRQVWFVVAANLLTGSTTLLVCAGSVAVFATGWIGAGVSLLVLLNTYSSLPQARNGVRRTGARFAFGDGAFLVAIGVLVAAAGGDVPLEQLASTTTSLPVALQVVIAALLVAAALARSSQLPFQGWLPFTLASPTPVSALLHAGVVNAGAILIIRFSPVIARHELIMIAIFLAGAITLVYASMLRVSRADVKGSLVYSTMAQMGFMIMVCGLGVFAAAVFHLIAHSLFKSALFLGAGAGVGQRAITRDLPARDKTSAATVTGAVGIAVLVVTASLVGGELLVTSAAPTASVGLLVFIAVTASVALATALVTDFSLRTIVGGCVGVAIIALGYVGFLHVFSAALQPTTAALGAPAWLLGLPTLGLLAVQLIARNPPALAHIGDLIYARSLSGGLTRPKLSRGVTS